VTLSPAEKDFARRALLPAGLADELPPEAAYRADLEARLMAIVAAQGYDRVEPPLVEFEDTLLSGGAGVSAQTFRLMDPVSQHMMGVRSDMTIQVARIATTRLASAPRPLRLSYAGEVLRVKGSQLRPERQFTQVGCELIGASGVAADVEIIRLAADALREAGVATLSVDLLAPPLVPSLFKAFAVPVHVATELRASLDRKDADAVSSQGGVIADALGGLLAATGPARGALMLLTSVDLPEAVAPQRARLVAVAEALIEAIPDLHLTIDPVENRGFEYHSGVGFTLFATGVRGELGRGGRYVAGALQEPAIGFSLYMDSLLRALPPPPPVRRLYLPHGTAIETRRLLGQASEKWVTIAGLEPVADAAAEARRLGCQYLLDGDKIVSLGSSS
jgi:ATP phosphoribosyltransferase regulatory subunit